jgi:CD109 antigen
MFQIGSKKPLKYLSYYVVGRGNVLISQTVNLDGKIIEVLEFDASLLMVPLCSLVVFYIDEDGTIVSDQTEIELTPDEMLNKVSISCHKLIYRFIPHNIIFHLIDLSHSVRY